MWPGVAHIPVVMSGCFQMASQGEFLLRETKGLPGIDYQKERHRQTNEEMKVNGNMLL